MRTGGNSGYRHACSDGGSGSNEVGIYGVLSRPQLVGTSMC